MFSGNARNGPPRDYRPASSPMSLSRALAALAGAAFFGVVAAIHGITATAASSIVFLGVLWLFTPAPIVFLARMWRPWTRYRTLSNGYLAAAATLSVLVLAGVGWIGSERGIHPATSDDLPKPEDYPQLQAILEDVDFPSMDGARLYGWFIPVRVPKPCFCYTGSAARGTVCFPMPTSFTMRATPCCSLTFAAAVKARGTPSPSAFASRATSRAR